MKKILIHTLFYKNYNYGGMLQAYALYNKINSMGFECVELLYEQSIKSLFQRICYKGYRIVQILKNPIYYKNSKQIFGEKKKSREEYIQRYSDLLKTVFEEFMQSEFKTTSLYFPNTADNIRGYDFYVVGGDQVWNPEWTDKNFFFSGINDGKKVGYSCSAGKDNFTIHDKKRLYKLIRNMDIVSVREKNFSEMLKEKGINNSIIADPVFLLTKSEWVDFINIKYDLFEHYIFAYLLGDDKERRDIIKKFAKRNNLKIVSIPHVFRYYIETDEVFADLKIYDAGPREFVSLVSNADFVVTDSFHGTAFSLIFEKQFLNFSRFEENDVRSLNVRLKNIMEEYEISDRLILISELENIDIGDLKPINYEKCNRITNKKRDEAILFLNDSLDNI